MVRKFLQARRLLAERLNNETVDPYPGTRPGKHFLTEADGVNLARANTFPKGYIFTEKDDPFPKTKTFYKSGYNKRTAIFNIYYLVKDKVSYTDIEGNTYKEQDYLEYMKEEIVTTLSGDFHLGDGFYVDDILQISNVEELTSDEFPFKIYQCVIPIQIKWINTFGQASAFTNS